MVFRFISKQATTLSVLTARRSGKRAAIGMLLCTALGVSAYAQGQLDFIDPLGEERARIEKNSEVAVPSPTMTEKSARDSAGADNEGGDSLLSRARDGASSGVTAAQERADGFWTRMRAGLSDVAASLGLPTTGLLGLLGLLLAGIACLVGWTMFRSRRRGAARVSPDSDVYQRDGHGLGRRKLGDRNPLSATQPAADQGFEETMPEDFDTIFRDEAAETPKVPVPPITTDAENWRKPNLDKLRESIKADWKADKVVAAKTGLATAGAAAVAVATPSRDAADRTLSDISDGWEAWDDQVKPEDDPWGETLVTGDTADAGDQEADNAAALRRIRALRESLKAS